MWTEINEDSTINNMRKRRVKVDTYFSRSIYKGKITSGWEKGFCSNSNREDCASMKVNEYIIESKLGQVKESSLKRIRIFSQFSPFWINNLGLQRDIKNILNSLNTRYNSIIVQLIKMNSLLSSRVQIMNYKFLQLLTTCWSKFSTC